MPLRIAALVPAFQAENTLGQVVRDLASAFSELGVESAGLLVVDDGSSDRTANVAREAGARVLRHETNRGKGAALLTGFAAARDAGANAVVSVDADGQHPASEALKLARAPFPRETLVLGVRDLARAGAPRQNRLSNRFSNAWLSFLSGQRLSDTQCGLRRYPLPETLELGLRSTGYELESEVILRARARGFPIAELPVTVIYPPEELRVSHFHVVRDPARIVHRVLSTAAATRLERWLG